MAKLLFVAPDYVLRNQELTDQLRAAFPRIVGPTRRDQAIPELIELGSDVNAIIIGVDERLNHSVLDKLPNLELVGLIGIGTDRIDIRELAERQIPLVTAKGANSIAVAEHALSLILAALKNLPRAFRASEFGLNRFDLKPRELHRRIVGTVGAGDSAQCLHRLLSGFECERRFWTPNPKRHHGMMKLAKLVELDDLFAECDVISLHVPLTDETVYLLTPERIWALPHGAILVNTARGELAELSDVAQALIDRQDIIYAVDDPPTEILTPLGARLISTPHIAGITDEALLAMQHKVVSSMVNQVRDD